MNWTDLRPDQVDAVVLDLGGVVLSWAFCKYRTVADDFPPLLMDAAWEKRLGLSSGDMIRLLWGSELHRRAETGEIKFEKFWPMVGKELNLNEDDLAELFEDYWAICCVRPDVAAAIRLLRSRYRVGALSNAWSNARGEVTRRYSLDRLFDFMVISGEFGVAKPDRRIYHEALRNTGSPANRVVYIDDVQENVSAAARAGFIALRSTNDRELLNILQRLNS
jgi:putative hydrolase of the HAD superfamily